MFNFLKKLSGQAGPSIEDLNKYKEEGATFLDVRTPIEYAEGHVKGSINIPVQVIDKNLDKIKKMQQPIITYCRSGARSGQATNFLKIQGMESFNAGGFANLNQKLKK